MKGVANHYGPESCADGREAVREAVDRGNADQLAIFQKLLAIVMKHDGNSPFSWDHDSSLNAY
jgi:hypothetical protein